MFDRHSRRDAFERLSPAKRAARSGKNDPCAAARVGVRCRKALKNRTVFAVNRKELCAALGNRLHEERPAADHAFLIGKHQPFARTSSRKGGRHTGSTHNRLQHGIRLGIRSERFNGICAGERLDVTAARRIQCCPQRFLLCWIGDRSLLGMGSPNRFNEFRNAAAAGNAFHTPAFRVAADDVDGGTADRTGSAKKRNGLHRFLFVVSLCGRRIFRLLRKAG